MEQANCFELTSRGERRRIKGVNPTVAEIAHEQITAEPAKAFRSQCQTPGRIEFIRGRNAPNQIAGQVVGIDETVPRSRHVVFSVFVLKCVCYVKSAADVLNSERCKPGGKIWIGEVPR